MNLYKDTFVAKGSALANVLEEDKRAAASKVAPPKAPVLYKETLSRYEALYSKEDRDWFWQHQLKAITIFKATGKV